jgi:hypothetical protein
VTILPITAPGGRESGAATSEYGQSTGRGSEGGPAADGAARTTRTRAGALEGAAETIASTTANAASTPDRAALSAIHVAGATRAAGGADAATASDAAERPRVIDPANVDRLIDQVIDRARLHATGGTPGLESRFHDPQLGDLRLVVVGRPGDLIRAELFAADPLAAEALSRAADRAATGPAGLAGIQLHIRTEAGSAASTAQNGSHERTRDGAPQGGAGASGQPGHGAASEPGRDTTRSTSSRPNGRTIAATRSATSSARTRTTGLDIRA